MSTGEERAATEPSIKVEATVDAGRSLTMAKTPTIYSSRAKVGFTSRIKDLEPGWATIDGR
jgi:hypothetical protein